MLPPQHGRPSATPSPTPESTPPSASPGARSLRRAVGPLLVVATAAILLIATTGNHAPTSPTVAPASLGPATVLAPAGSVPVAEAEPGALLSHLPGLEKIKPDWWAPSPEQRAAAAADCLPLAVRNTLGMRLVLIPAGSFAMGSPPEEPHRFADEVIHRVTLSRPFFLAATETTQEEWSSVMGANPASFARMGARMPVERVSWTEVLEFCNRLSELDGCEPAHALSEALRDGEGPISRASVPLCGPHAPGYRLPTEAEWEWACRSGTTSAFSTGEGLSTDRANYDGDFPMSEGAEEIDRQRPIPVASFPPNAWGLFDMHGNLAEWCWDGASEPSAASAMDPLGRADAPGRIVRGGSWKSSAWYCRSAFRHSRAPDFRLRDLGFRVARSPGS